MYSCSVFANLCISIFRHKKIKQLSLCLTAYKSVIKLVHAVVEEILQHHQTLKRKFQRTLSVSNVPDWLTHLWKCLLYCSISNIWRFCGFIIETTDWKISTNIRIADPAIRFIHSYKHFLQENFTLARFADPASRFIHRSKSYLRDLICWAYSIYARFTIPLNSRFVICMHIFIMMC